MMHDAVAVGNYQPFVLLVASLVVHLEVVESHNVVARFLHSGGIAVPFLVDFSLFGYIYGEVAANPSRCHDSHFVRFI